MSWTKERLQSEYNLTDEEVLKTLKVCNLPIEQDEYSDQDIESKFKLVRSYFDSNRTDTYTGAADLLALEQSGEAPIDHAVQPDSHALTKKLGRGRKPKSSTDNDVFENQLQSMSEILAIASKHCNTRISLKEAALILDACGLPDTEEYTPEEAERFMTACDLVKQHGKSYQEVAALFGVENTLPPQPDGVQRLIEMLGASAVSADEELLQLINKITAKQADYADIHRAVQLSYLHNVSLKLAQSQNNRSTLFDEIEARVMDYIEGKSPVRSLLASWDWQMNSLPPSSPKPMSLPSESDNGTSAS